MKNLSVGAALVLGAALLPVPSVRAVPLVEPQVEYSADSVMETELMTMRGRIYYTPAKQRNDMGVPGMDAASYMIIHRDKNVIWNVMPDAKMYMEMSLDASDVQDLKNLDWQETVVGEEIVNGMKTTKYKAIATAKDGKKYGGFSWRTKDGVTVKADLLYKEGTETHRIKMELTNLKVGKQDPKLFEVPATFAKTDMGAMMGMGHDRKGRPDLSEMMKGMKQEAPGEDQPDMDAINNMMKQMMGK